MTTTTIRSKDCRFFKAPAHFIGSDVAQQALVYMTGCMCGCQTSTRKPGDTGFLTRVGTMNMHLDEATVVWFDEGGGGVAVYSYISTWREGDQHMTRTLQVTTSCPNPEALCGEEIDAVEWFELQGGAL